MAILDRAPPPVNPADFAASVWGSGRLAGGKEAPPSPFVRDAPGLNEGAQLAAGEVRLIRHDGAGEVLLLSLDVPAGVTAELLLDGQSRRYTPGNEAANLRFEPGRSPYRFQQRIELVVTNTTGVGQPFKAHFSGA